MNATERPDWPGWLLEVLPDGSKIVAFEHLPIASNLLAVIRAMEVTSSMQQVGVAAEVDAAMDIALALRDLDHSVASRLSVSMLISGLPRTGTTLVQELVSQSGFVALRGRDFSPDAIRSTVQFMPNSTRTDALLPEKREYLERHADRRYEAVRELAPDLFSMHPLGGTRLEECTPIVRLGGPYIPWWFMVGGQGLLETLADLNYSSFYEEVWAPFYRRMTPYCEQVVAKSPLHFLAYGAGFDVGTAQIVHIRRSASDALRSVLTMAARTRALFGGTVDLKLLGGEWIEFLDFVLGRASTAIGVFDRFVALDYDELIARPDEALHTLGIEAGERTRSAPRTSVARPEAPTNFPLGDFGVSAAQANRLAARYPAFLK